jgi:hypothetical protein
VKPWWVRLARFAFPEWGGLSLVFLLVLLGIGMTF